MPKQGGSYKIRDGERVLVHQTKPAKPKKAKAPDSKPAATPAKTEAAAPKPAATTAKAAAKQEVAGDE